MSVNSGHSMLLKYEQQNSVEESVVALATAATTQSRNFNRRYQ